MVGGGRLIGVMARFLCFAFFGVMQRMVYTSTLLVGQRRLCF